MKNKYKNGKNIEYKEEQLDIGKWIFHLLTKRRGRIKEIKNDNEVFVTFKCKDNNWGLYDESEAEECNLKDLVY